MIQRDYDYEEKYYQQHQFSKKGPSVQQKFSKDLAISEK